MIKPSYKLAFLTIVIDGDYRILSGKLHTNSFLYSLIDNFRTRA